MFVEFDVIRFLVLGIHNIIEFDIQYNQKKK